MVIALLAAMVALVPIHSEVSWTSTAEQLRSVAETYKKWGITFELDKESKFTGGYTPVPAHLEVTGVMEAPDRLSIGIETAVGEKHALAVHLGGNFKIEPDGSATEGTGALYVEGRGLVGKYSYSRETGVTMEAGVEESFYTLGIKLGQADAGPFALGLKLGPLTVNIDPTTYAKRFVIMAPEFAKKAKEKIGGVTMRVDSDALLAAISEAPAPPPSYLAGREAVSLKGALSAGAKDLGRLTSIEGLQVDEVSKDIVIIGVNDPTLPPIPLETVAALARCVYVDGTHPWISIDPQSDFKVPHHARIGDVPTDLRSSGLIESMLGADYSMKQLTLGKHKLQGVSQLMDLLTPEQAAMSQRWRLWIAPSQPSAGDLLLATSPGARYYRLRVTPVIKAETTLLNAVRSEGSPAFGPQTDPSAQSGGPGALLAQQYTLMYHSIETSWPESRFAVVRQQLQISSIFTLLAARERSSWESELIHRLASKKIAHRDFSLEFPGLTTTRQTPDGQSDTISGGMLTAVTLPDVVPGGEAVGHSSVRWHGWQGTLPPPIPVADLPAPVPAARTAAMAEKRAEIAIEGGDGKEAETAARVALAFKPGWDEASISLVRALALQNSESCVGLLTKSIQQSPKSWRLLLLSAMLHQGQRDYYAAVKDADKVIALAPNTARAYAVRAACRGREEYDVAVKDWARAQQLAPGSAELYIGSAGFYLWHEKPKEALKDLQLAIRCDPINSKNYLLKGLVLMDLARPAEAVTALRNAVSLAPADWQCRTSLGTALYTAADYAGAIEQMSLALRLRPRTGQLDLQPGTIDDPPALFRVPHPPLEELIDRPENPNQITIVELPLFDPTIWVIRGASQYKLAKPAEALPDLKRYIALADMFHEYCEKVMHAPPIAEVKKMAAEASR